MSSNLYDIINFVSTLTIKKSLNYLKLRATYLLSIIFRRVVFNGLPVSLSIEPTTNCNLRCPECPSGLRQFTRKTGFISLDQYQSIIDQAKSHLIYLLLYFQGEPFLHPEFFEMVRYAKTNKIYTATSTNAHFLGQENARQTVLSGLDRIIISIDGATHKSYLKYRIGGNLDKVLSGTKNLVEAKKQLKSNTPYIIFQTVIFRTNENEQEKIKKLGKELGVDKVLFKTAQFYNLSENNPLVPQNADQSRYLAKDGIYTLKAKIPNKCWRSWHNPVITIDGKLVPCCFDKDANYEMGDLKSNTLMDIFKGNPLNSFRQKILSDRNQFEICRNCTEGIKVHL